MEELIHSPKAWGGPSTGYACQAPASGAEEKVDTLVGGGSRAWEKRRVKVIDVVERKGLGERWGDIHNDSVQWRRHRVWVENYSKKGGWRGSTGKEGRWLPDAEELEHFISHSLFFWYNELLRYFPFSYVKLNTITLSLGDTWATLQALRHCNVLKLRKAIGRHLGITAVLCKLCLEVQNKNVSIWSVFL